MNGASERQHAHELIERLPDSQIGAAVRLLEFMLLDPVARALAAAPPDDEPVTEQDRTRFLDGQAWFARHGKGGSDGTGSGRVRVQRQGLSSRRVDGPLRDRVARRGQGRCRALGQATAMRLFEGIIRFARTGSGDVKVLHGDLEGAFRLRLGDYRILFTPRDNSARIFGVRHRSQAYR